MFTSRAEYRLQLRQDNADQRLTGLGEAWGIVGSTRSAALAAKMEALDTARTQMLGYSATPNELRKLGLTINQDGQRRTAMGLLGYPEVTLARLAEIWPEIGGFAPEIAEQIEIDGRYAGYLKRQDADIVAFRKDEALLLPQDLDYDQVPSLSAEVRQKLKDARPASLGAAQRISGITPAALTILLRHVRRQRAERQSA